ncbi:MAG TPA: glycolate oxidase subunit GlcF [Methylophilaceae bacterium]|nr:glycolate oxidase subunit GlcF [Methylophilaceae bacterium]HQR59893.1 glycolate oxidase subunit GlcF [Methylophilaceae bacterium]
MQTRLPPVLQQTAEGREAEAILRACVHCGFCTAVCPTYRLLGNELDSPRGRIYLIKSLLEGEAIGEQTRTHLDRCLTCHACETACPSGVQYARLADIGRAALERQVPRPWPQRLWRWLLRRTLASPRVFAGLLAIGRTARPLLPAPLKRRIAPATVAGSWPPPRHARRILAPAGCVQPALAPGIDAAMARLLDAHGVSLVKVDTGCCGALDQHLAAPEQALHRARVYVDVLWPQIEAGAEAVAVSATGCGAMVREYAHLLRDDSAYAARAARVSALCRDPVELLETLPVADVGRGRRIAFHSPCTLQHALRLEGRVEALLQRAGFILLPVEEAAQCCGAAGTYSILQPGLSEQMLQRKLGYLQQHAPELIATANIGCLTHLQGGGEMSVVHWVELLAEGD